MRILLRFLLAVIVVALVLPFLAASLLLDRSGTLEPGRVVGKDEWITVSYSSWTRHQQIQVQYAPPDEPGLAFLNAEPRQEDFDRLRKGDTVDLRYLLAKDLPAWPGMKTLRKMHLLPVARLATHRTWSGLETMIQQGGKTATALAVAVLLVFTWRVLRLPFLKWIVAFCLLAAIVGITIAQFPVPTSSPKTDVKIATGTVKSVDYWKELFETSHGRSTMRWVADQPIAVVAMQFVPEDRTEPVLAVDLIDAGSVDGLAEHARVSLEYESKMPRVAHLRAARRQFAEKNVRGLLFQGGLSVLVLAALWGGALLFGRLVKNLIRSNR